MKKNDVVILTEAGEKYGFGHLTRCLSIAQGLKKNNWNSIFYLRGNLKNNSILSDFNYIFVDWLIENIDFTGKLVILDSYYADKNFCQNIYKKSDKVLFIDDYSRITYPGGVVLNSAMSAETISYPRNSNINYLLGVDYHPLRKEFWEISEKKINKKIDSMLITLGGSDVTNQTPSILKKLTEKYPDIIKKVIIGSAFSNVEEIKNNQDKNTELIFSPNAETMKNEMIKCDVAISAAGQTLYELARIGVPTYAVQVAENQTLNMVSWKKCNFLLEDNILNNLPDFNMRKRVSEKGQKIIDGNGVFRIYKRLING